MTQLQGAQTTYAVRQEGGKRGCTVVTHLGTKLWNCCQLWPISFLPNIQSNLAKQRRILTWLQTCWKRSLLIAVVEQLKVKLLLEFLWQLHTFQALTHMHKGNYWFSFSQVIWGFQWENRTELKIPRVPFEWQQFNFNKSLSARNVLGRSIKHFNTENLKKFIFVHKRGKPKMRCGAGGVTSSLWGCFAEWPTTYGND